VPLHQSFSGRAFCRRLGIMCLMRRESKRFVS
jgi:hypothetical protein